MKKMSVGLALIALLIALMFSCIVLTGCRSPSDPPEPRYEERWIFHGKLYLYEYGSNGTYKIVYQVQGNTVKRLTIDDEKLIDDLQAAVYKTRIERPLAPAGASSVPSQARAASATAPSVKVFVLDFSNQFERIDPGSLKTAATLDLFGPGMPGQPIGMDVTADSRFAVLTETATPPNAPYALLIDLTTFKIASKINLPLGIVPEGVAITPDGLFAYIAATPYAEGNDSTVFVLDIAARNVVASLVIPGDSSLDQIVMTPDGVSAYLASDFSYNSAIRVIDIATNSLALTASTAGSIPPLQMAMHPDGTRLYLVPTDGSTIQILNTATHTISGSIPGAGQGGLFPVGKVGVRGTPPTFTPDGRFLFILGTADSISMIDTATDTQIASVATRPLGPNPGRPQFFYFVAP